MCGIMGVFGGEDVFYKAIEGLKRLEYRGYDSWGIAFKSNNEIKSIKKVGKISNFTPKRENESRIAIAHTRWATHGNVSRKNAHPIFSNNNKIAVVHNGIIENYLDLKKSLIEKGFVFETETDTEIIANLIEDYNKKLELKESIISAFNDLKGSYAFLVLHEDYQDIFAIKSGSPLAIGLGDNEMFISSDVSGFIPYTKEVAYLEDGQLAILNDTMKVYDLDTGNRIEPIVKEISWNFEEANKNNYEHFMRKEIDEQPSSILKSLEQDDEKIKIIAGVMKQARNIFLLGCGTSYHSCLAASYYFSKVGINATPVLASEFDKHVKFLDPYTLVVAVSQSGETADLIDAIKKSKPSKCKVLSITNTRDSTITRLSDESLFMNSGPEICVLSTKSYTAQLTIFALIAYTLVNKLSEGKEVLKDMAEKCKNVIADSEIKAQNLVKNLLDTKDLFVIGRGISYPGALEGALKIKEVSYIHAEGFAGGELKHGTIALIEHSMPCIAIVDKDSKDSILSNAQEIKSRGGIIIGISNINEEVFDYFFQVPNETIEDSILFTIPLQLIAYYLALELGLDPDKPRNLAKSVTVK